MAQTLNSSEVTENINGQATASKSSRTFIGTIQKVIKNITVEPLIICWLLPFLVTYAAIENMNLEKGCRALVTPETGFSKDVCKIFVRKSEFDINCLEPDNTTRFDSVKNDEIKAKYPQLYASIEGKLPEVYQFLCDSENKVQDKLTFINSIRNPISSIGPLIIILFAGPWSDKKNLRVPCMLVPFVGEALGYFSLFIAAIFINGPVEFPAYTYRLLPSLTGAENLMVMGIYSYLTAISSEENRTFRFGMFQILMTIVPIIAQSISPSLIKRFEYAELFGTMIPIHIIGFFYAIFFLKEPVNKQKKEEAAYDNPAMSTELPIRNETCTTQTTIQVPSSNVKVESTNACLEFFDPQHAIYCIGSFFKKREFGLRRIIILFMIMHFLVNGITQGETQNLFLYVRVKMNWDIDTYVYLNVFTIVAGLIGTSLAVGVLSKLLKVADIFLIILSTFLSIIARIIYVYALKTITFFIGTGIDFMYTVKFLGARSIISKLVSTEDLSSMFALMGLFEALAGFVFPYIYPTLYTYLLNNRDISEMFVLSGVLLIIAFVVYTILWKLLKRKNELEQEAKENSEDTKL